MLLAEHRMPDGADGVAALGWATSVPLPQLGGKPCFQLSVYLCTGFEAHQRDVEAFLSHAGPGTLGAAINRTQPPDGDTCASP